MFLFQAAVSSDLGDTSFIQSIVSFFTATPFVLRVYLYFKYILIVYSVILLIAVILVLIHSRPKKIVKQIERDLEAMFQRERGKEFTGKWQEILKRLALPEEASYRIAVIEADKFFEEAMRRLGYVGENFSDRLKQIHPTEIKNLNEVWQAHRVRNSLAHDPDFKLSHGEAAKAVDAFEKALQDLEVI